MTFNTLLKNTIFSYTFTIFDISIKEKEWISKDRNEYKKVAELKDE